MGSLYELAGEYARISEHLHDLDMPDDVIRDTLESYAIDLNTKAQNVCKVIRNLESDAKSIKDEEERLKARRQAIEKRTDSIKRYLKDNMITAGIEKIESPWFVISVRNNPESVVVDAESQIPQDYMREIPAKYEPDKELIKRAIKDGYQVPGCHLERKKSLVIK